MKDFTKKETPVGKEVTAVHDRLERIERVLLILSERIHNLSFNEHHALELCFLVHLPKDKECKFCTPVV